jgi:hypothetical protein
MSTVSVIIPTFGDRAKWNEMAMRAAHSVACQTRKPDELIRIHGDTLAQARNRGAAAASSDFLCFLDADDELHPCYLERMLDGAQVHQLRYPLMAAASGVHEVKPPVNMNHGQDVNRGNFMVIGTLVARELFHKVGGFQEYEAYEDWALWLRCIAMGAFPLLVEGAVYVAYQREKSRNSLEVIGDPGSLCRTIINELEYWKKDMGICELS